MKKASLFILVIFNILLLRVYAHDNNVVHPFTLTGKAIDLLRPRQNPTEEQKKYSELRTYFYGNDEMPSEGYKVSDDEYNYTKLTKEGTIGTIAEDNEGAPIGQFGAEVPNYSMFNHFYYAPKNGVISEPDSFVYLGISGTLLSRVKISECVQVFNYSIPPIIKIVK